MATKKPPEPEVLGPNDPGPEPRVVPAVKWWSMGALTAASMNIGSNVVSGSSPLGAFTTGDLYIVMAFVITGSYAGSPLAITGTGWTKIIDVPSTDAGARLVVWWKNAGAGETGIYTVSWTGSAQCTWAAFNLGQPAFIDAWNGNWNNMADSNIRLGGCAPTSAQSLGLAYWFSYGASAVFTLPGSVTSVANLNVGIGEAASAVRTLSVAGMASDLTATNAHSDVHGGFQIAIAGASPPGGGGGTSPLKWIGLQNSTDNNTGSTSIVVGQDHVGVPIGTFATGDLYVIAFPLQSDTVDPGVATISGTGWTTLISGPLVSGQGQWARLSVWAKNVGAGETGLYTVSWPSNTGFTDWAAINYGQTTVDVFAGQSFVDPAITNCAAPSVTPTQTGDILAAYWHIIQQNIASIPANLTIRDNTLQYYGGTAVGETTLASTAATGVMNATPRTTGGGATYQAFQLAMKPMATGGAPPVPTGLTATPVSSSQINLSWSASAGATSYVVLRGGVSIGTPASTSFSDTGLTASTNYTYTVEAVSGGGTSAPSAPASATTFASGGTVFPLFTPLLPPPLVGQGGGPPPTFPPPTPPPIGAIPVGVQVGPAIAAAPVPPSTAGIPLIRFTFGSATTPAASAAFPEFTTTFPSPPIVFSNIFTDGVSPTTPPSTVSTQCIALGNVYGPPIGPALPAVVPPRTFMAMASSEGDDEAELDTQAGDEDEPDQEDDDNPGHENESEAEDNPDPEQKSELKRRYSLPPRRTKAKPHRGPKPKK